MKLPKGKTPSVENPIYLDYNATTPVSPEVARAMAPYLEEHFGNPSSSHVYGRQTRQAVDTARLQLAALLGADSDEIVFTSGGSEANNMAIKGAAWAARTDLGQKGNHIITTAIEHPAVQEVCDYLQDNGFRVTRLPVNEQCLVQPADLQEALTDDTILLSVMHANNETGVLQPVAELAEIARARGVLVHCDAAQTVGKIPVKVADLGVDLLSVAGHKFYGPKGVGALYIRRGVKLEKLIHGADHEQNRRAGTESVLLIAGLGAAAEDAEQHMAENIEHALELRDRLWSGLQLSIPDLRLNGPEEGRLPNTLNVSFPRVAASELLAALPQVAASAGAACHSGEGGVSGVMAAMKVPAELARGTVRFSTGRFLTAADVDQVTFLVLEAYCRLIDS
jgi:cysteine desulfurase